MNNTKLNVNKNILLANLKVLKVRIKHLISSYSTYDDIIDLIDRKVEENNLNKKFINETFTLISNNFIKTLYYAVLRCYLVGQDIIYRKKEKDSISHLVGISDYDLNYSVVKASRNLISYIKETDMFINDMIVFLKTECGSSDEEINEIFNKKNKYISNYNFSEENKFYEKLLDKRYDFYINTSLDMEIAFVNINYSILVNFSKAILKLELDHIIHNHSID